MARIPDKLKDERWVAITEKMYLSAFFVCVVFAFLKRTILPIPWAEKGSTVEYFFEYTTSMPQYMEYILCLIILLRIYSLRQYRCQYFLCSVIIYEIVKYAVEINGYDHILLLALLIIGAKEISFDKIMKLYTWTTGILLVITMSCALLGVVENVEFGVKERMAFGIGAPTDFAAHVFFLMVCMWFVWGYRHVVFCVVLTLSAAGFVYYFSKAKCSAICLIMLSGIIVWNYYSERFCRNNSKEYIMNPIGVVFLSVSVHLAAIGTHVLTMLYDMDSDIMNKLNTIMTNRLELGHRGIEICGFQFWGQRIHMIGNWGYGNVKGNYFYLDSSYLQMSLMYGLIISVMFLFATTILGYRAYQSRQWKLLWILSLMAVHGIMEQRLFYLAYCPFLLAVSACLGEVPGEEK